MKEKLLILDDEATILRSLEHLFEDDYEVLAVADAGKALGLAGEFDIAVILCDERMPGISGHDFLRRVKEISAATRLMMSGHADMNALTEAVNSGQIFAYIAKPWEPRQLKAQVAAALVHFKLIQEVDHERGLVRALMEGIPDLIYFKDLQSRFTRVNRACARTLGAQDAAACVGKSDSDYFESVDALRWRAQEEEIVRSGHPQVDCIEQIRSPWGAMCWVSTTKIPIFDRRLQLSGIAGISRDITVLKNSEEMLREQNEHNRMIIETASDAFIGMDPDGSITAWNPQAEIAFGWTAAEARGRRLRDILNAPGAHAGGTEDFLTSGSGPVELVATHRDGHEFPVEAAAWQTRRKGVSVFNVFLRDITDRRRAEAARVKETTLIQLLQQVTVAANRSSSIEHTARVCLDQICAHTAWPVGHAYLWLDGPLEESLPSELWHLADARFEALCDTAGRFNPVAGLPGRVIASRKAQWMVDLAGEEPSPERTVPALQAALHAELRSGFGVPVLVEDKIVAVLEFYSLRTEPPDEGLLAVMGPIGSQLGQVIVRQRVEAELRRAKASAESANRAKSEFLSNMSHEMRTPMNAILGMADMIAESTLAPEQEEHLRIVQRAGEGLLDLINQVLDISKVESGLIEVESIGFHLRSLLERVIAMMAPQAEARGLRLSLEVLPGVHQGLAGDANRLRQILVNLIANALKFTERGSVILRVQPDRETGPNSSDRETGPNSSDRETGPGWLRFNVVDTGIGIALDKTEMIFERFTQVDSSTTRKYGGTGLGLAISRGLAELMGGRIGCTSDVGKGSTFFFTAPFEIREDLEIRVESTRPAPAAIPALPPKTDPPKTDGSQPAPRILIAEDSDDNLLLFKAYLKGSGYHIDCAENGLVAVDKAISGRPALVLMDLQMPLMDGLEATRAIRRWEAKTNLPPMPIVALTAHGGRDGIARSLAAGCTEHLTKPIKKEAFLDAISHYVGPKAHLTPS